ncbi:MAG: hypothetical protein LBC64_00750 [Fibromonadaceae bacterium]|jgi:hypothetical protein|nr:hypothetical protein [Fibromonadaceae bacterium]
MKNTCNIISDFCSPVVREKIVHLYNGLKKHDLLPNNIELEQKKIDLKNNNLFFVTYDKNTEQKLRKLMYEIDFKKRQIIIISNDYEDYFDFAMEYNLCNIIHINNLSEDMLLGIFKKIFEKKSDLKFFFEDKKNVFDKQYSISGDICMRKLVKNTFTDFYGKIPSVARSTFIINCHELITNAIAYGVLGITAHARDKKAYDIGSFANVNIPKGKDVKVRLMMNDKFYGISVKDRGGSLTIQRILERIRRQSIVAGETVPQGIEDYTGRGLAILSHHGLLVFSLKIGKYTEVSLISQIKASFGKKPISILATEF